MNINISSQVDKVDTSLEPIEKFALKNANYIDSNIIIADEKNTTKKYCKKAQVGVDCTVKNIYKIKTPGLVLKDKSFVSTYKPIKKQTWYYQDTEFIGWKLRKGTYLVELNEGVDFGPHDTGLFIQRSSLNRSGATIVSSVWDPGFNSRTKDAINTVTLRLNVDTKKFFIEENARLAQLLVWDNEDTNLYNGQFQNGRTVSKLVEESK